MEVDDLMDRNWTGRDEERPSKKRKRGPGRPRKPDHLLVRPRRPRYVPRKRESTSEETIVLSDTPIQSNNGRKLSGRSAQNKKAVVAATTKADQAGIIAAQQEKIESMEEKIRQYEAKFKAMEAQYGITPPTPAMSVSNPHPFNTQTPSHFQGNILENHLSIDTVKSEREDSPLSVYSDLIPADLLSAISPIEKVEDQIKNEMSDSIGKENVITKPSLIVTLKANPVIPGVKKVLSEKNSPRMTPVSKSVNSPAKQKSGASPNERKDNFSLGFAGGWFRSKMRLPLPE